MIGEFSVQHHTGGDAWTATFLLMALAIVPAGVVSTAIAVQRSVNVAAVAG